MKNLIVVILFAATMLVGAGVQAANATSARTVEQDATATPAEEEEAAATPAAAEEEAATPEAAEEEAATPEAEEEMAATPEAEEEGAAAATGMTLPETVRQATAPFKDLQAAEDAGYALVHGCVSGPNGGAMGVHFANGDLVGDGEIDAEHPEAVIYEQSYGKLRLVGVEYIVLAEAWDANHDAPPVLVGQLFNYNSAPNRYGLPAFYELHVWAWKFNPTGVFADWNPLVSCEEYTGMDMAQ